MQRMSKKRRRFMNLVKPIRSGLINEVGRCEICRRTPGAPAKDVPRELTQLCCHEIANGPLRAQALDKRFALLVLCWYCNGHVVTNKAVWPQARQLAFLRSSRPQDFDLVAFNHLVNPNAPDRITIDEVDSYGGQRNV